jgi:poly-gamma-glutamate capsule biosynthesis protein CapA/YwtB (metallophosphatase superfamily)
MLPSIFAVLLGVQTPNCTIVLGGDIMLNQITVESKPLGALKPLLKTADIAIANLEIPLTRSSTPTPFKTADELKKRTQYILKADPEHILGIRDAGIDMVSLANNHVMDYGVQGLNEMIGTLERHQIPYAGAGPDIASAKAVASIYPVTLASALAFVGTPNMTKLGPAGESRPGLHALIFGGVISKKSRQYLENWISGQRDGEEIFIVALHWGLEKQTVPTSYQVALARACIDAGADVVWGHHPHVLQGAELYKGKPILYSMGNLISRKEGPTGVVRLFYKNLAFNKFRFIPLEILKMRVQPTESKQEEPRKSQFRRLSEAIQRKFPHKQSKPLY